MTKQFGFTPEATIELADDGKLTLEIDWSASERGEFNEETAEYEESLLSHRVAEHLGDWLQKLPSWDTYRQKVEIGTLPNAREWAAARLAAVRAGDLHLHEKELTELIKLAGQPVELVEIVARLRQYVQDSEDIPSWDAEHIDNELDALLQVTKGATSE